VSGDGYSFDPRYTAVRIEARSNPPIYVFFDVDSKRPEMRMWKQVNVGNAGLTSPVNVELISYKYSGSGNAELLGTMHIGSLDLTQVSLRLTRLKLLFQDSDSTLSMRNSSLLLYGGSSGLGHVGASLSINALSGDNSIENGLHNLISSPVHIRVSPGASLTWREFLSNGSKPGDHLRFSNKATTIDVDGGRFVLDRAQMQVDEGVMRLRNGAELYTTGSEWGGGYFKDLRFSNSRLTMDHTTEVSAKSLLFADSRASLSGHTTLSAGSAVFTFDSQIIGPEQNRPYYVPSYLKFDSVLLDGGATLTVTGVGSATFKNSTALAGSRLHLDRSTMFAEQVELWGGRLDISSQGVLVLASPTASNDRFTGILTSSLAGSSLNVLSGSILSFGAGTRLLVDDRMLEIQNEGRIQALGHIAGNGTVNGNGAVVIRQGGALAPSFGAGYGSIHIDNELLLEDTARVVWRVDATGQLPTRPLVTYGPRPVVYEGKPVVEVHGTGSLSADALAGKSITVIAAQSASAAGTIQTNGLTPSVRPVDMPALLSYTVGDTGTNGKPDVTLFMDKLPVTELQKHPALTTKNRQSTANLLVAAATTNPSITSALNTVTNEQLAGTAAGQPTGFLDQIHAEPYSSFTTVNLEAIANLRNLVFMQALDTDPRGQRFWLDTVESRGDINGQQGLGSFGYGLSSLTVGKDLGSWRGAAWGAYLSMGQARMDEHDIVNQRLKGHTTSAGLYGQWRHASWEGRLLLGYGQGQQESTRQLNLPNTSQTVTGRYGSRSWQAGVRLSMGALQWRALELRPEIGGSLTTWRQAGFTEAGSASYALQVAGMSTGTRIVHAGLNASLPRLWAGVPVRPVGFLRLEHDFAKSREHAVQAALATQPGNAQRFTGQGRGPSTATAALGLVSDAPGAWQVGGGLAFSQHTHGSEWSAGLRLKVTW